MPGGFIEQWNFSSDASLSGGVDFEFHVYDIVVGSARDWGKAFSSWNQVGAVGKEEVKSITFSSRECDHLF